MTKFDKSRVERLKSYTRSERQTEILEAVLDAGGMRAAARKLGCKHQVVSSVVKRVERYAALQGFMPDGGPQENILDPHYLKGTSTLYDNKGKIKLRWVKTNRKLQDALECMREFAEGLGELNEGKFERTIPPKRTDADLLTVYPLADLHLGMLAWSAETREDYDVKIASDALNIAASLLTDKAPPSKYAIVANLGDFFHFDDDSKQTAASGNILDVDSRWAAVIRLGVENMIRFIRFALEKHERVKVINSIGNHDGQSALMLPFILKPYFMNEPRIEIEEAPRLHHYHIFGSNLLGFFHGHKTAPSRLHGCMTSDVLLNPEIDTSKVEFAHWLTGHVHHESKEFDGVLVESFRTLAAKDAYHAGAGYRAMRDMQAVVYDREFGECDRARVSFKMVQRYSKRQETRESTTA